MLLKFNPELLKNVAIVHGATEDSAKKILSDIGLDDTNSKTYNLSNFMKDISSEWKEYPIDPTTGYLLVPKSDYNFTSENEIISALGITESTIYPSLVIIDEVSKFSSYDMDLINKFARKYGITILVAGDFDQSGVVGSHPISINDLNLRWDFSLNRTNFIRTPKLGVSMRTDNSLKTHNLLKLQAFMQDPNGLVVNFDYFEDETGLYGDKFIMYEVGNDRVPLDDLNLGKKSAVTLVIKDIDKLIDTLQPGEKIGYIYTDATSPIYNILSSDKYAQYIDLKEGGSALGLEGRYYIIEASPNQYLSNPDTKKSATNLYLRDIYTGITRALQGSIIIAPVDIGPKFNSTKLLEKINESLNKSVISQYSNKRKLLLESLVPSGNPIKYTPRTALSTTTVKDTSGTTSGIEDGIDSTPPPVSDPPKPPIIVNEDPIDILPSKQYLELQLNDCPEAYRKNLLQVLERVINNPQVDNGLDVDDSKTDLKYGQIVRIGDPNNEEFGVIYGVKAHENGKHEYSVIRVGLDIDSKNTLVSSDNITGIISTLVKQNVVLSHLDMVDEFGEIANINNIIISINGQLILLPLCLIPFENSKKETGTNNMINYWHRNIVVVNINGVHMPFYMSTGEGGKKNVKPGSWYPIFGIKDGWLNKGTEDQINLFYGSPILQSIAELLNQVLGTGYESEIRGTMTYDDTPQIDFINLDMDPVENNKPYTPQKLNDNIQTVLSKIDSAINKLIPENNLPLIELLVYEDLLQPIIGNDITNDADYQLSIDVTNLSENIPKPTSNNGDILMLLHSFNTFETGVLTDENEKPIPNGGEEWGRARIDSVNGLLKIDSLLGHEINSIDYYIELLGKCRSILFNTKDKSQLVEKLQNLLKLSGINVTFALKSTPRPGDGNKVEGREFVESSPTPFSKGISELTLFNGSSDTRSHEWHPKSIVAVISSNGNNILELPLLALSSPFTLIHTKDSNNLLAYPDVMSRFDSLSENGLSLSLAKEMIQNEDLFFYQFRENLKNFVNNGAGTLSLSTHEIAETLYYEFKDTHPDLANLFKLYSFTDRAINFIKDPQWTIANNFQLTGAWFVTDRGMYLGVPGFDYDKDSKPEDEWIDVSEFKRNPQITMTDVLVSVSGKVESGDGTTYDIAKAGHPFVLVSHDLDLSSPSRIVDYYTKQLSDPSIPRKVTRMYVLPPKASIREYVENLHAILNKETGVKPIGLLFTSYKLLKTLISNESFKTELERKIPGALLKLQTAITEIESLSTRKERKNKLYEPLDWSDIGITSKPTKLAGLFDSVLTTFLYNRNTLGSLIGMDSISVLDERSLQLVEGILNQSGINGIYYNVLIHKTDDKIGPLNNPNLNYLIDGKPFKIHGKLDSYLFKANVGEIVSNFLLSLKPSKDGKHYSNLDSYLYMKSKSITLELNPELIEINNLVLYIATKTGLNTEDFYNRNSIDEANRLVVNHINVATPGHIAFTIGSKLFISNTNDILTGNTRIFDSLNNPITDISNLVDNNGIYNFKVDIDGVIYNASFNEETLVLTPTQKQLIEQKVIIGENAFPNFMLEATNLLLNDLDVYLSVNDLLKNLNYNNFVEFLKTDEYIEDELEEMLEDATPELLLVLNTLLTFKRTLEEDTKSAECPQNINIIF